MAKKTEKTIDPVESLLTAIKSDQFFICIFSGDKKDILCLSKKTSPDDVLGFLSGVFPHMEEFDEERILN